jgi:hypothetical protein
VKQYIEKFKKVEELDDTSSRCCCPRRRLGGQARQEDQQGAQADAGLRLRADEALRRGWQGPQQAVVFRQGDHRRDRFRRRRPSHRACAIPRSRHPPASRPASGQGVPKVSYEVGEEVKITTVRSSTSPDASTRSIPDRGKLKISVSIFGRFTPVELEYWQIERHETRQPDLERHQELSPRLSPSFSHGQERSRLSSASSSRRRRQSRAPGRSRAWRPGRQHHGVLQGLQRPHQGPERHDPAGRDHGLRRQVLHVHPQVAAGLRASQEGRQHRQGLGRAEPRQGRQGHAQAAGSRS